MKIYLNKINLKLDWRDTGDYCEFRLSPLSKARYEKEDSGVEYYIKPQISFSERGEGENVYFLSSPFGEKISLYIPQNLQNLIKTEMSGLRVIYL